MRTRMFGVLAAAVFMTSACGASMGGSGDQGAVAGSSMAVAEMPEVQVTEMPAVQVTEMPAVQVTEMPTTSDSYITLEQYEANKAAYTTGKVVLFFNARWCSTCKRARANLESNLAAIPAGLTIVLVDYDSSIDLRTKYGVTMQHTFVQIDANGVKLAKWSGSQTAEEIEANTV